MRREISLDHHVRKASGAFTPSSDPTSLDGWSDSNGPLSATDAFESSSTYSFVEQSFTPTSTGFMDRFENAEVKDEPTENGDCKDILPASLEGTTKENLDSDNGPKVLDEHTENQSPVILGKDLVGTIRKIPALTYIAIKYSTISLAILLIGILALTYLGVLVAPDPTCQLVEAYVPDSLSVFTPCLPPIPVIPGPDPLFVQAVHRSSTFAKLQKEASKNDKLPLRITSTRHDFRKLLMELRVGVADTSSVASLYSLIPEYNFLLDNVVDGMQDCRSKTRGLVDEAIIYTEWTNSALQTIEQQNPSFAGLIDYTTWWRPSQKSLAEKEVEKAFDKFAVKLEDLAGDVYNRYQDLRGRLRELERKLESIAVALRVGRDGFEETQLTEYSWWKESFESQPYLQKMEDLERKAKLCADFHQQTMEAVKVVDDTIVSLSEARAGIQHLREEAGKASLPRGKEWSLKLTIKLLESSVAELQAAKSYRVGY